MKSSKLMAKERHLILIDTPETEVFELDSETVYLGRDISKDIVIGCHIISRIHATFVKIPSSNPQQYSYRIFDGEFQKKPSKNGISVNNRRCLVHLLDHGDLLSFANVFNAIYLKVYLDDENLKSYISILLKNKKINQKERDQITLMTQIFCKMKSDLTSHDSTSIMLG